MLNFWNYFFILMSFFLIFLFFFYQSPLKLLFLSELNWVVLITNSIVFSTSNNDPRFFLLTFIFLFLAAIEIVFYLFNFTYKTNKCLNYYHMYLVY